MTNEIHILICSCVLGILHLIAASHFISFQYGYRWTASNREEEMPPLKGMAGRVDRAATNFLETFPFFATAVIIAHVAGKHSALTLWGANLYFWGRIVYAVGAKSSASCRMGTWPPRHSGTSSRCFGN
jgi:uncharacterized MAPEG superfamily protein